jgi:pyruvate dehydrogenase E2 component (dihydrolipoamide acetyltransferase)
MEESPKDPAYKEIIPLKGWRKAMADMMLRSHSQHAPVTQMREVDVTELVDLRRRVVTDLEEKYGVRISYTHFIVKAVAQALRLHPIINSVLADGEIRVLEEIHVALAVATEDGGLLAPVIRQADRLTLVETGERANKLAERVRARRFSLNDLKGGTFTVSNAGMYGTDYVTVLLTPPQSAALGIGRIVSKPAVRDNQIVIRSLMGLSLTYDHQVFSGVTAARFFATLQELIESPAKLELGI